MQIRTKARQLDRGLIPARTRPSRSPSATPIRSPGAFGHFLDLQRAYGNRLVGQMIQAKLAVSQPGDPYEREADRVADQVLRMPATAVQRKCAACEEVEQHIQRSTEPAATASPQNVAESFVNGLGPGHPLDVGVRAYFEPRFGADFSGVRIHSDPQSADSARAIHARAYTLGNHVAFARGAYRPQTREGRRLLAHELTHVLQQGGLAGRNAGLRPAGLQCLHVPRPFLQMSSDTCTYGEIRSWAITSLTDFTAPGGLGDAKASIGAVCARQPCTCVDGSGAAAPGDQHAWANIVAANGADQTGGGDHMCVGHQGCERVHSCVGCQDNHRQNRERDHNLEPVGTCEVSGKGTLYFYSVPFQGWCTEHERVTACHPPPPPRRRRGGGGHH